MPYFSIETNKNIDEESNKVLMKEASGFIAALLGKPEQYVMVSLKTEIPLIFGGSEGPAAIIQLKSIGLPVDRCSEFSEKICDFIQGEFGIPKDRVFIDFKDIKGNMFGWNGKTF